MKYFIVTSSGSSLFAQSYPEDFCFHCLYLLIDNPIYDGCRVVSELEFYSGFFLSLFACDGSTVSHPAISWGVRGCPSSLYLRISLDLSRS